MQKNKNFVQTFFIKLKHSGCCYFFINYMDSNHHDNRSSNSLSLWVLSSKSYSSSSMFDKNKLSSSYPTSFNDFFSFFSFSYYSIYLNLFSSTLMLFDTYSSGLSSAFFISERICFEFADVVLNGKYLLLGLPVPVVRDIEFT